MTAPTSNGLDSELHAKVDRLGEILRELAPVAVAFSGGVDSSLLYCEARRELGDRALAVIGRSPSLAHRELEQARAISTHLGAPLWELETTELARDGYRDNDGNRCFHCKTELYQRLKAESRLAGWTICDGSHADDSSDDRPGMRAASRFGVVSPLRLAGLGKGEIRRLALFRGLPNWNRPARPCLASRILAGTPVSQEALSHVEELEEVLADAEFEIYRARVRGGTVIVQLGPRELSRAGEPGWRAAFLETAERLGFGEVLIDLRGYRSGEDAPR